MTKPGSEYSTELLASLPPMYAAVEQKRDAVPQELAKLSVANTIVPIRLK